MTTENSTITVSCKKNEKWLVKCLVCGQKYKMITNTHIKLHGMTQAEYLAMPGARLRNVFDQRLTCKTCGQEFTHCRPKKVKHCPTCIREVYNANRREQWHMHDPPTKVKRMARFFGTVDEKEAEYYTDSDADGWKPFDGLDEFHASWDFVPGKRGYGKKNIGYCDIGTLLDSDLDVIFVNGQPRVKAFIELERSLDYE